MNDTYQVDKFSTPYRKCLDFDESCPHSGKSRLCTRQQMFFHILKIPTKRMIRIVQKYNLVRFPLALGRYTLANLITDYTSEVIADEIIKGDTQ